MARKVSRILSKRFDVPLLCFDFNHEHFEDEGYIVHTSQGVEDAIVDDERIIVFRPNDLYDYNDVFEVVYRYGDVVLLIDEAEMFISSRDTLTRKNYFLHCVQLGRHRNISIVAVGRRVVELNPFVRAQATRLITFKQTDELDLQRLQRLGFDVDKVKSLEKHKFLQVIN